MTADNAENKIKAGSAGAIEAVVAAMRAQKGRVLVQVLACWALSTMTANNDGNQEIAGRAGAIEAVVAAMCEHDGCERIQAKATEALAAMAAISNQARR